MRGAKRCKNPHTAAATTDPRGGRHHVFTMKHRAQKKAAFSLADVLLAPRHLNARNCTCIHTLEELHQAAVSRENFRRQPQPAVMYSRKLNC